ncbi:hypothetical protein [Cystobacter fuscus]|uniref:hypothetical protein n=1 Tax=Cystobacter fuscus TaxID=43 RepID=UPI0037BE6B79
MDSRHLSAAAYSAFTAWLLKLRGVPVSHQRLLSGGCPAEDLPALVRELKRIRTDFKRRLNSVSAPVDEPLRQAYAALGVPWSAWSEVAREVHRDLQRGRYAPAASTEPMKEKTPRVDWAELLRRTFALDVFACPQCGGRRKVLAYVTAPAGVRSILEHLGLPTQALKRAPARGPPQQEWC